MAEIDLTKTYRGVPNDPTFAVFKAAHELPNWHVYQMNEWQWVASRSAAEAMQWYLDPSGGDGSSVDEPVTECRLDTECWSRVDDHSQGRTTYGAIVLEHLASGKTEPFCCATTEF